MKKIFIYTAIICVAIFTFFFAGIVAISYQTSESNAIFTIKKGESIRSISDSLNREKIINSDFLFYYLWRILYHFEIKKPLAGDFEIKQNTTYIDIINLLCSNNYHYEKITIPEGLMVSEIVDLINKAPYLSGEIIKIPEEGYLMPNTYLYSRGDTKQSILNRMEKAMNDFLNDNYILLSHNYIKNKHELLTLASIVESESANDEDKKNVAAIFVNRLKKDMRLQADPTTIYEIARGQKFNRKLTKPDMLQGSTYNTYKIKGLPVGPISCPGEKAILAVLNPANVDYLYFVVTEKGKHTYSNTYEDHLINVEKYKEYAKKRDTILAS